MGLWSIKSEMLRIAGDWVGGWGITEPVVGVRYPKDHINSKIFIVITVCSSNVQDLVVKKI